MSGEACSFDVLGLTLHGQRWRNGPLPVLALHGWLDNSESFALLAPHLEGMDVVALDLAGHGLSDHRAAHASYLIWDDLREILAVADALGWQRFGVIGHSRGAIVAALLAAAAPERITALGLLDGLWAKTCAADKVPAQLARSLAAGSRPPTEPVFASLDEMVDLRIRAGFPISRPAAARIVERNALQADNGLWSWRTDPRLKWPSLMMLTPEQQTAIHQAIQCPVFLALAGQGLPLAYPDYAERLANLSRVSWQLLQGDHHLHMAGAEMVIAAWFGDLFRSADGS